MTSLRFRPRRSLLMACVLSAVLGAAAVGGWLVLPANIQALFTMPQLLTLAFFVLVMIALMMGVGLSYLRADAEGLRFRNGLRTHQLEWSQVRGLRFTEHDPWAYVECDNDVQRPMLGIQRTDRELAEADFASLVALWAKYR